MNKAATKEEVPADIEETVTEGAASAPTIDQVEKLEIWLEQFLAKKAESGNKKAIEILNQIESMPQKFAIQYMLGNTSLDQLATLMQVPKKEISAVYNWATKQ
jgi:hypothetical protein